MSYWNSYTEPQQEKQLRQKQNQISVQTQDVAMRQILLDQMDNCFKMIKWYLDTVIQTEQLKREQKDTTEAKKTLELSNFIMGQSINLLQVSLNDCFQQNQQEDVALAQSKVFVFGQELSESIQKLDNKTRVEIQKRVDPIRNNLLRIVKNEKVPLNAPPILTEETFNEKTVGTGMSRILKAGHEIQDRIQEVKQKPNEYYNRQEKLRKNTKKDVDAMLSCQTKQLKVESMMQDINKNRIDRTFDNEEQSKNTNYSQYKQRERNEKNNYKAWPEQTAEGPDLMGCSHQDSKVDSHKDWSEQMDSNFEGPDLMNKFNERCSQQVNDYKNRPKQTNSNSEDYKMMDKSKNSKISQNNKSKGKKPYEREEEEEEEEGGY